ncbi:MAG: T9SS type A sorting domain-containing protein [Candidatus Zixiibacteriota bacterium]|nr:MAG: T9SS type A sorting domain-containing protein [candidate division Zixibacteria bacterium]
MRKLLSVLSLAVILALFQGGLFPADAWSIPQGACCYPDGSCADDQSQAQCEADGGTYMGDGTACFGVECVAQPQGACCYPDGSCADDQYQAQCEADGGTYMGDLTTCAQVECDPQAQGACCYADGSCVDDLTRAECSGQGGVYMGDGTACFDVECDTDVKDETGGRERPSQSVLFQNHPNPFNQTTKIEFTLAKPGFVSLSVYDLLGRKVKILASEHLPAGYKSVSWDGKNDSGEDVASGIYFYQLRVRDYSETKTLVLLK